jgi:G3E family GTPase
MSAHDASIVARVFTAPAPIESAALGRFLATLGAMLGPKLLRVKGLVGVREHPDQPLLIQGAQHVFAPPRRLAAWPDANRTTRIVVIADGLAPAALDRLGRALSGDPEIDMPDLAALSDNPLAPRRGGLLG